MNQTNRNMLEGPLFPNIIRFTIPIILTSVLQLLFNAADLVVVGQFCGSVSVAAVGATGSITGLLVNFFIGLSVGAGVAVAHGLGGRENQVVHRTVHTALPTAILSGAILTVAGLTYSETFLIMMGTPDTVLPLSTVYMRIIFCGVTFNMVYNFCASILRAAGDTKSPLVFLLFAGILNVILNLVFVIQFQMNVAGVALATIISQAVSAVLVVIALMRRTDACKLYLNKLRFYKPQLAKILRIGLPAGIQSALFAISNVLIQSSVNSFGDVFMSGNAAASNLEGFVYVCLNAFHQSAVNFVGQNAGAKQYLRVRQTLWICLGVRYGGGTGAWVAGLRVRPLAALHLHHRLPGSHLLWHDPSGLHLPALFHIRHDGRDHRRASGHRRVLRSHDDLHSRRVRLAHRLDLHHFPDSPIPHATVPVSFLSCLMGHHLHCPAGRFLDRVPKVSENSRIMQHRLPGF